MDISNGTNDSVPGIDNKPCDQTDKIAKLLADTGPDTDTGSDSSSDSDSNSIFIKMDTDTPDTMIDADTDIDADADANTNTDNSAPSAIAPIRDVFSSMTRAFNTISDAFHPIKYMYTQPDAFGGDMSGDYTEIYNGSYPNTPRDYIGSYPNTPRDYIGSYPNTPRDHSNTYRDSTTFVALDVTNKLDPIIYDANAETDIIIKKFYNYRPVDETYFTKPPLAGDKRSGHAVIMPFFNEESHEMQQTLNSLGQTHDMLRTLSKKWRDKPLYVCLIQDGWHKASESMKLYLKHLFNRNIDGKPWWEYFEELTNPNCEFNDATFVIEKKLYAPVNINPQDKIKDKLRRDMVITLIIKSNNRRKHNSHEWFLARTGFAQAVNAKYLFLTDAFTLYADKCLFYLTKDLDNNKSLSGVTGRQRLMTRDQQGSNESVFSLGYILRMLQLFDFELANAVYNGAFSLGGLLPVIPGPCGLYRASDLLQDKVRDSYFNVVNEEPSNTGLVLGNLRIAEDRILTYDAATKTADEKNLVFNPIALFYFEAETNLEKFVLQRRRWINGSVAGYIYLLFIAFQELRTWKAPWYRKIYVAMLLFFQFVIYCMVAIVPGISLRVLYYGLEYFMDYYEYENDTILVLTFIGLWAIYILHVFIHNKCKFYYPIWIALVILSLATTLVSYGSLFHYAFIASKLTVVEILRTASPVFYMAVTVFLFPFVNAILLSGRGHSFLFMIKSVIPYMLFIPLLVGWFGAYSYSRIHDLSWGNRPANELTDINEDQRKIMITKFKEKSVYLIYGLIGANIAIFFVPREAQLYIISVFFGIAIIQMAFSAIYCIMKIPYKIRMMYISWKRNEKIDSEMEGYITSTETTDTTDTLSEVSGIGKNNANIIEKPPCSDNVDKNDINNNDINNNNIDNNDIDNNDIDNNDIVIGITDPVPNTISKSLVIN